MQLHLWPMSKRTAPVDEEAWLAARKKLLKAEKEFTKKKDELNKMRMEMPWREVTKDYSFTRKGKTLKLSDMCTHPTGNLIVVHFMFEPGWEKPCPSCSWWADAYSGILPHLHQRTGFVVVGAAADEKLQATASQKGWTFPFYSSQGSDFSRDFNVEFTDDDIKAKTRSYNYDKEPSMKQYPGYSVFRKEEDKIFHTYSTYVRGMDLMNLTYNFFDILPDGRAEEGLPFSMLWVKHKDAYERTWEAP